MKTLAIITAFPPSAGSLNEYGYHLVKAFAAREDIKKIIIIADKYKGDAPELDLGEKIEIKRIWRFNSPFAGLQILRALKSCRAEAALYNLQTASFGDKEIPAALGLLTPALSHKLCQPSGVIMHNLVDAIDLSKTTLAKNPLRQKIVAKASFYITKLMLKTGYVSVTLDSFWDILKDKYKANNAFMVPHGAFPRNVKPKDRQQNHAQDDNLEIPEISQRDSIIVTMGKYGTYKRLERSITAVQTLNKTLAANSQIRLIIGGSDHPAAPNYMQNLAQNHADDDNIIFHGYVAEEDVAAFFTQARLAVFDYDSTTGSSGVLHQAAIYGTPAAYPLMGDFIDVTEREGLKGFHFQPLNQNSLETAIMQALNNQDLSQNYADNNLLISEGVTMQTVASLQMQLLSKIQQGAFNQVKLTDNRALHIQTNY